jgi:hypothetical protein
MYKVNEVWVGVAPTKQKFQNRIGHKKEDISKEEYVEVLKAISKSRSTRYYIDEAVSRLNNFTNPVKVKPKKVENTPSFQKAFNVIALFVIFSSCIVYAHHSSVVYTMLIDTDFTVESGSFMGYVFGIMVEISVFSASLIYAHSVKHKKLEERNSTESVLEKFAWGHLIISLIYFQVLERPEDASVFEWIGFATAKIAFSAFLAYTPYTIKNLIKF